MIKVKVLRPFNATPQGELVDVGDEIEVTDVRASELVLLGLAEHLQAQKAASVPENKMAPQPENKEESAPKQGKAPVPRGRRGARKVK